MALVPPWSLNTGHDHRIFTQDDRDDYTMRPYVVHVRGCRYDGHGSDPEDYPHLGGPETCTGCGNGHLVDAERARAAISARIRRSCGICRPHLALGVEVVRLDGWGRDRIGGLYAARWPA